MDLVLSDQDNSHNVPLFLIKQIVICTICSPQMSLESMTSSPITGRRVSSAASREISEGGGSHDCLIYRRHDVMAFPPKTYNRSLMLWKCSDKNFIKLDGFLRENIHSGGGGKNTHQLLIAEFVM